MCTSPPNHCAPWFVANKVVAGLSVPSDAAAAVGPAGGGAEGTHIQLLTDWEDHFPLFWGKLAHCPLRGWVPLIFPYNSFIKSQKKAKQFFGHLRHRSLSPGFDLSLGGEGLNPVRHLEETSQTPPSRAKGGILQLYGTEPPFQSGFAFPIRRMYLARAPATAGCH